MNSMDMDDVSDSFGQADNVNQDNQMMGQDFGEDQNEQTFEEEEDVPGFSI
jgi:hypothetical protein